MILIEAANQKYIWKKNLKKCAVSNFEKNLIFLSASDMFK